jgi:hypothetical protein
MTTSIKTVLSALISTAIVLSITATTYAQSVFWQLDVSTPTFTQQTATFNLDYNVVSTEANDEFTVELLANGTTIESQNVSTSGKYGYNGRFVRSNVPEGTYTYIVKATRSADTTTQQTAPKTVSVDVPDARIVTATTTTPNGNTATAVAATTSPDATATGATAITPVTETASTTSATEVKGTSDTTRNFTIAGLLLLALAGGAIWYGVSNYLNKKDV